MAELDRQGTDPPPGYVRSPSETLLNIGFADRGEARGIKWAGIAALLAHFLTFVAVIQVGPSFQIDIDPREITVVRRYTPPEPPESVKKVVRRRKANRVPIPDASPDEPELILPEEVFIPEDERVDSEFIATGPLIPGPPPPPAFEMDTDALNPPRLLECVEPEYDRDRARRGVQGTIDIEIVIGPRGTVVFTRVINSTSDEELDRSALAAVEKWTFEPAELNGEPVPVRAVVTINFRIY